jgi:glycerol kinase
VETCISKACEEFTAAGHSLSSIKAVGITNQRETTCVWDAETGEPLYNSIVWTDTRTASIVRELKARPGADELTPLCGLPLSTYPSSTKLLWLLRHADAVKKAYEAGKLAFGTVDAWLVYKLNGGPKANIFVSDPTNASRTMWMNIHKLEYDEKLLEFFELDTKKLHLPKIVPSSDPEAYGKLTSGPLEGTRITGCLGDQSAALVGQNGFSPGRAKNTYGTGCFMLYNVGEKPVISKNGLLSTVAYDFRGMGMPVSRLFLPLTNCKSKYRIP